MRVLIIGAAGMLGARLSAYLCDIGTLGGQPVSALTLTDRVEPASPSGTVPTRAASVDVTDRPSVDALMAERPDIIFHLAAVVSGEAERDFGKGYTVNLGGTATLLDAVRAAGHAPRVVMASSLAVYGPPFPDPVPDDHRLTPRSSYGTQKAMAELLMADHTRRGHVDGRSIRLPTVAVRPGVPNAAASSFVSGIVREPLKGERAILPVPRDTCLWIASPDCAVASLAHAAGIAPGALGPSCALTARGISVRVADVIAALRELSGDAVVARIVDRPDPAIAAIVRSWPQDFTAEQAAWLGFPVDASVHDIISAHIREHHPDLLREQA